MALRIHLLPARQGDELPTMIQACRRVSLQDAQAAARKLFQQLLGGLRPSQARQAAGFDQQLNAHVLLMLASAPDRLPPAGKIHL